MMPKKQDVLAKLGDWAVTDPPFGTWADSCLWKMLLYELSAGNLHEIPCWRIGPEPPHAENILPGTLVPQRLPTILPIACFSCCHPDVTSSVLVELTTS